MRTLSRPSFWVPSAPSAQALPEPAEALYSPTLPQVLDTRPVLEEGEGALHWTLFSRTAHLWLVGGEGWKDSPTNGRAAPASSPGGGLRGAAFRFTLLSGEPHLRHSSLLHVIISVTSVSCAGL